MVDPSTMAQYLPHGMVAALAGAVGYIYKSHVKLDDDRYAKLGVSIDNLTATITANHTEILRLMLGAQQSAAANAAIAAIAAEAAKAAREAIWGLDKRP